MRVLPVAAVLVVLLAAGCTGGPEAAPATPRVERRTVTPEPVGTTEGTAWTRLADAPLSRRDRPVLARVGDHVVAIGGLQHQDCPSGFGCPYPSSAPGGAVYDLTTGRWRRIARVPAPVLNPMLWTVTGRRLVLVANSYPAVPVYAYDPRRDRWRRYADPPVQLHGNDTIAGVRGTVLVAPQDDGPRAAPVMRLDLATGRWRLLPRTTHRPYLGVRRLFPDPGGLVVVGGEARGRSGSHVAIRAERLVDGRWRRLPAPHRRAAGYDFSRAGDRLIAPFSYGGRALTLDLSTGRWQDRPPPPMPHRRGWQTGWAQSASGQVLRDGVLYDDATRTASSLRRPDGAAGSGTAVFVGDRLLVLDARCRLWLGRAPG